MTPVAKKGFWPVAAVSIATAIVVLLAPYALPPSAPVLSQSYLLGYNNRVAVVGIALISLAIALWSMRQRTYDRISVDRKLPALYLACWMVFVGCVHALLAWTLLASHTPSVEGWYFIPQLEKVLLYHRALYTQVEFPYGPWMFGSVLWLRWLLAPLHLSLTAVYYAANVLHEVAGVVVLFLVVNLLPMRCTMRWIVFTAMATFALLPLEGLNYSLVRFLAPYLFLLWLVKVQRPWMFAVAAAVGVVVLCGESPESGIAFVVGVVALSGYQVFRAGWWWSAGGVGAVCGGGLFALLYPGAFAGLRHFGGGFGYSVLEPSLELVVVLSLAVWFVPRVVGEVVADREVDAGWIVGCYAIALALLPAMFGNYDLIHMAGEGAGLVLLACVAFSLTPRRAWWVAGIVFVYALCCYRAGKDGLNRYNAAEACSPGKSVVARLGQRLIRSPRVNLPEDCRNADLDWVKLRAVVGGDRVVAPYFFGPEVEKQMETLPGYETGYFVGTINVWGDDAERMKIAEMRAARWLVLPEDVAPVVAPLPSRPVFTVVMPYTVKRTYVINQLLLDEVRQSWVEDSPLGNGFGLYRRR